jgi:hypothetical protein
MLSQEAQCRFRPTPFVLLRERASGAVDFPPRSTAEPHTQEDAEVNGIKLYYEIHGTGPPLILLHGGLGAIEMFGLSFHVVRRQRVHQTRTLAAGAR